MNRYLTSLKSRLMIVTAAAILAILTFAATSSALTVAGSTKRTPQRQASPAAVAIAKAKVKAASKAKTSAETKAKTEAEKKAERHAGARQQTAEFRVKILRTRTLTKTSTKPVSSSSTATTTVITTTATVTAAATPTTTSASQTPTIATATATASAPVTSPVATTPIATPALNTTITPTITTPAVTTPTVTTPAVTTPAVTTPTVTTPTVTTPTVTTPTVTTPVPATSATGVSGNWNLSFDDEFNGNSLNTSAWSTHDGWTNQNGVTDEASNISVSGGYASMTLSSATSGAAMTTNGATLGVGDYAEARVSMPGSGSTMDDWDAFWASGPAWPAAGENDVTESLGGGSTVNYHSPSGAHNEGVVPGAWAGAFHTYGIYRGSNYANVYWDGVLVKHYSTDDNSQPQTLIFTVGNGQGDPVATGTAGTMKIDYLRVWTPAS